MGQIVALSATIVSLQVGRPQDLPASETEASRKPWSTAIFKSPVSGPIWLNRLNLAGDMQADLVHHGGPHKAVCAYSADHYTYWRIELQQPEMSFGTFGENFTIAGLTEEAVCIGDVWQLGDAMVQVSQPRQPCWKLARRWGMKDLAYRVQQEGRTGWYFRVLQKGNVACLMSLTLSERPNAEWTVAKANRIMHDANADLDEARRLADLPELSPNWRHTLEKRLQGISGAHESKRLLGTDVED